MPTTKRLVFSRDSPSSAPSDALARSDLATAATTHGSGTSARSLAPASTSSLVGRASVGAFVSEASSQARNSSSNSTRSVSRLGPPHSEADPLPARSTTPTSIASGLRPPATRDGWSAVVERTSVIAVVAVCGQVCQVVKKSRDALEDADKRPGAAWRAMSYLSDVVRMDSSPIAR